MTSTDHNPDLPSDNHLQDDISAPSDAPDQAPDQAPGQFTPGQTNAGQQVGGLASATQDPDDEGTKNSTNNPI